MRRSISESSSARKRVTAWWVGQVAEDRTLTPMLECRYRGKWLIFRSTPDRDLRRKPLPGTLAHPNFLRYEPSGGMPPAALPLMQAIIRAAGGGQVAPAGRLTRPGPWESPEGRPQPYIDRHGDPVTPREDTSDTAYWYALLIDYIEGRPPPASVRQPRVTPKLRMYAATHDQAAREFAAAQDAQEAARAGQRPPVPVVLEPAQALPASAVEEITTAQAQDLTGLSAERWRQLARAGRIRSRRTHHQVLLLDRADVIAYDGDRRSGRGIGSGEEPAPAGPAGDPGGPGGGSAASGGRAA